MMYRVQFAAPCVRPVEFPGFPYTPSEVTFDKLLYTVIIEAGSTEAVVEAISHCWPNAEVRLIQPGQDEFKNDDVMLKKTWFGTMPALNKSVSWKYPLRKILPLWFG